MLRQTYGLRAREGSTMLDLFETMENCRAMRRLKPDPVSDDLIARVLHAGTCAPSGGNAQ
jgi:nitroreductase